ncbi:MAG: HEPN domain-containing protein, partial [Nitrososphaeria archaeon]
MKETDSIRLAELEIKNSKERLEAAELLLNNGKIVDSINRAYYAMFHAARALLLLYGIEPKTHEGVVREFSRIIVEEKVMDKGFAKNLRQIFETRESVDYRIGVLFDQEEAEEIFIKGKRVCRKCYESYRKDYKGKI